jgi:hypothetical protein
MPQVLTMRMKRWKRTMMTTMSRWQHKVQLCGNLDVGEGQKLFEPCVMFGVA